MGAIVNVSNRDDLRVDRLIQNLDDDGIVCLPGVVPTSWLDSYRAQVQRYVTAYGNQDFLLRAAGRGGIGPAQDLLERTQFSELMTSLVAAKCPQAHRGQVASCLRVLAGPVRHEKSMLLHYDANVVTMVVPIFVPQGDPGRSGELVVFPNKRPFRRFTAQHVVDKITTHNTWFRRRAVRAALGNPDRHFVDLQPGNAYLFWGYRTFHGNLPLDPNHLRATLILHFGLPHANSRIIDLARAHRARRLRQLQRFSPSHRAPF